MHLPVPIAYQMCNNFVCARAGHCLMLTTQSTQIITTPRSSAISRLVPRHRPLGITFFAIRASIFNKRVQMSGLEVAGLVLGAFPIAIEVLGRYKEVARRLGFWYKVAAEHKKCDSQLKYYRLIYENNLKRLLLPLTGLDDKQIDKLLQDPAGSCWTEAKTAESLEKRLGSSYEVYLQCMDEIHDLVKGMNHELSFDVATKQSLRGSAPAVSS